MAEFRFVAYTQKGRKIKGEQPAKDERELARILQKAGLELIQAKIKDERPGVSVSAAWNNTMDNIQQFWRLVLPKKLVEPRPRYDGEAYRKSRMERAALRAQLAKGDTDRMPTFVYTAKTEHGTTVRGEMEARDDEDLALRLELVGLTLKRVGDVSVAAQKIRFWHPRLSLQDTLILCHQLQIYFRTGMLPTEIFDSMRISAGSKYLKAVLWSIRERIVKGEPFHVAVAHRQRHLGRFFVSLAEVADISGRLSEVFAFGERHLQWQMESRREIIRELRWPLFTFAVCSGLIFWFLTYATHVVLYQDFTLSPEWNAKLQRVVSPLILHYWSVVIAAPLIGYWLVRMARLSAPLRLFMDRAALKLPIVGELLLMWDTVCFTHLFGIMWQAGVQVEEALLRTKKVMMNTELQEVVDDIALHVRNGETVSAPMQRSGMFNSMVSQAFAMGERTGGFERALDQVYYFYIRVLEDAKQRFIHFAKVALFIVSAIAMIQMGSGIRGVRLM